MIPLKATHLQHILVCQFSRSPGRSLPHNISDTTGCRDQISQLPVIRSSCVIIGAHTQSHKTSQKKRLLVFTPFSKCITSRFVMKENNMLSCTWLLARNAFTIQLPGWCSRTHARTQTHARSHTHIHRHTHTHTHKHSHSYAHTRTHTHRESTCTAVLSNPVLKATAKEQWRYDVGLTKTFWKPPRILYKPPSNTLDTIRTLENKCLSGDTFSLKRILLKTPM